MNLVTFLKNKIMKIFRLFLFAYILCCFNPLFAQDEMGNGYLFPEFERGTVAFKNGVRSSALLNYSMLNQEMLFLDDDNNIMKIANPNEVLVVIIGEHRFFPISKNCVFYEEIPAGNGSFFVQHNANMISEGKATAYGGYSQTSAVTSYGTFQNTNAGGGIYKLNVNEKFRLKHDNYFYIKSGKNYKKFSSAKTLAKLFKGQELKIEEFANEHSLNFTIIEDIAKIVEFCYSLPKK